MINECLGRPLGVAESLRKDIREIEQTCLSPFLLVVIKITHRAPTWRPRSLLCSGFHKEPPEVFLKILLISQKNTCVGVSYLQSRKPSGLQLSKKWPLHRCIPVKIEKFWRTPILKNIWTTASVYWLLHHILIFTILYSTQTIELMMREAVSFEEVFHWTKFLAFES